MREGLSVVFGFRSSRLAACQRSGAVALADRIARDADDRHLLRHPVCHPPLRRAAADGVLRSRYPALDRGRGCRARQGQCAAAGDAAAWLCRQSGGGRGRGGVGGPPGPLGPCLSRGDLSGGVGPRLRGAWLCDRHVRLHLLFHGCLFPARHCGTAAGRGRSRRCGADGACHAGDGHARGLAPRPSAIAGKRAGQGEPDPVQARRPRIRRESRRA